MQCTTLRESDQRKQKVENHTKNETPMYYNIKRGQKMALQETGLILDQGKAYDSNEFWIEGNLLVKYLGKSKEVTIPDVVTVIGDYAFGNATEVKTVNIPNSVVEIRDYAFRCCGVETVNNSANLEKMGKYVFNGCSCLMNIRFGGKIREIPEGTFFCCSSLKFMYLPENIKKIGVYET